MADSDIPVENVEHLKTTSYFTVQQTAEAPSSSCNMESNSVLVLDDVSGKDVRNVIGNLSQKQLQLNLIAIMSANKTMDAEHYFLFQSRALTPRMVLFVIDISDAEFAVTQVLGTGLAKQFYFKACLNTW